MNKTEVKVNEQENDKQEGIIVHFPQKKSNYTSEYFGTFKEIIKLMKEQKITIDYGDYSGFVLVSENDNYLRIMRGELYKEDETGKGSNFYCSMLQFNDGDIYMMQNVEINKSKKEIEIEFEFKNKSRNPTFRILITKEGWEMYGKPPEHEYVNFEQIKEIRSICSWVKIIPYNTKYIGCYNYVNIKNKNYYVLRDSLGLDNGLEEIIDNVEERNEKMKENFI